jgi:hypothetical protein
MTILWCEENELGSEELETRSHVIDHCEGSMPFPMEKEEVTARQHVICVRDSHEQSTAFFTMRTGPLSWIRIPLAFLPLRFGVYNDTYCGFSVLLTQRRVT